MTKDNIKQIVKRYPYIVSSIKRGLTEAVFEIGNRKKRIELTEELKIVCEIVREAYEDIQEEWKKKMIGEMLSGAKDLYLWQKYPCAKNSYYKIKQRFIDTIVRRCIYRQIIAYEELMGVLI